MEEYLVTRDDVVRQSGLEIMNDWLSGARPLPPMAHTMNYGVESARQGEVVLRATPLDAHTNPYGVTHGGWFGTVMDTATTCAVITRLPAGQTSATLEYKVNTIRPLMPGTEVFITGVCAHVGRSSGVATGEIRDAAGKLYATGSQTVLVITV